MLDGKGPAKDHRSDFEKALAALNRLFAFSLSDAKLNSTYSALTSVKNAKMPKQKSKAIKQQFQGFVGLCVSAIREWWPKYVELALAYPIASDRDALH